MDRRSRAGLWEKVSIRYTIFIYFTVSALVAMLLCGVALYEQMSRQLAAAVQEESEAVLGQVNRSVDSYIRTIMKLSDSLYYGVIKNADLSTESINDKITLLYDNNKDSIANIALLSKEGELLEAVPAARLKTGLDVTREEWFAETLARTDNLHFSTPHVQYIFDNNAQQYRWVITLSRAVEITHGTSTEQGILLIDIRYSSLQQILEDISLGNQGYLYMIGSSGELIYHPKMQLIGTGQVHENIQAATGYRDGSYREEYEGESRNVSVKSVGYTGWKLLSVTPKKGLTLSNLKMRLFVVFVAAAFLFALVLINAFISSRITNPIKELEKSVNDIEAGKLDTEVYAGGSYEIQHLGRSIGEMAKRIKTLMQDIVAEHESKRKSEFDTLQSQINPHFLNNTLEIINWEARLNGNYKVSGMIEALSTMLGETMNRREAQFHSVAEEMAYADAYLYIISQRFGAKFRCEEKIDEQLLNVQVPRLIIQPIVENAVEHGMDTTEQGRLEVRLFTREDGYLCIEVEDNGHLTEEDRKRIDRILSQDIELAKEKRVSLGIRNVDQRLKMIYGADCGLFIESNEEDHTVSTILLKTEVPSEQ